MKRVFGLVFLFGAASCITVTTSTIASAAPTLVAQTGPHAVRPPEKQTAILLLAPADEYFGPLKLSFIGMRNTIRDLGRRYDVNHDIPVQTIASAELTERAVRDWERKYPHDTQIPKTIYLLQRLYTKVLTQDARDHAHATAMWLFADFGRSAQARQLKKTLAVEHLAPLPTPSGAPAASSPLAPAAGSAPAPATDSSAASATPLPSNVSTIKN